MGQLLPLREVVEIYRNTSSRNPFLPCTLYEISSRIYRVCERDFYKHYKNLWGPSASLHYYRLNAAYA